MPKIDLFNSKEKSQVLGKLISQILKLHPPPNTKLIAIQGGQGTGKSTLARYLKQDLEKKGFRVETFSIDDFYLPYSRREILARKNKGNPFYKVRGMPGSHRISYLNQTFKKIKAGKRFALPLFDKSLHNGNGDVIKEKIKVNKRPDFVIFEGWCIGIPVVSLNELVKILKKNNFWGKIYASPNNYQVMLDYLRSYQKLWKYLDYLIMLKPDSMDLHFQWRWQQERELIQSSGQGMTKKQVKTFVNLYLPLTYVAYAKVTPDMTLLINKKHEFYKAE